MKPSDTSRLERRLVLLLLLFFCVPLPLTLLVYFTRDRAGLAGSFSRLIIGEAKNSPSPPAPAPPPPSFAGIRDASYQLAVATSFNTGYSGRDWILRATNEVYLRLFRASSADIVVGRGSTAFYDKPPFDFVSEYCVERSAPDALKPLVDDLRRLRDNCRQRGVAFVVVVTPSKAAIYPEELPLSWRWRTDPRPRNYDQFVRLLRQEKIPYVDGHLLTLEAKREAPIRVFPIGGIHWSHYAAMKTANAVLTALAAQGQPVRPVENPRTAILHDHPGQQDADMVGTIHPLFDWSYPVDRMRFYPLPTKEGTRPSLVISGTSFVESLGWYLNATGNFSETHWLRFYKLFEKIPEGEGWRTLREPLPRAEREQEIFSTQCLVLEFNEQLITYAHDLADLYDEPVEHLPDPKATRKVFPYENLLHCQWGQPLNFTNASLFGKAAAFGGMAGPSPIGSWTVGPDTTMRLAVPSLDQDAVVAVDAGAALAPGKLPVQHVTVFANEQPVAAWTYDASGLQRREAVIPQAVLGDGRLILRLHFAQTITPAEIAGSSDTRPVALLVQQVSVRQRYGAVDFALLDTLYENLLHCQWGQPLNFTNASLFGKAAAFGGMAGPSPIGSWTVGPDTTMRLAVPSLDQDAVVAVDAGAALAPGKLPVQHVTVFANEQPVAAWTYDASGLQRREAVIPQAVLGDGRLILRLHFAQTITPAEIAGSSDTRPVALLVQQVSVRQRYGAAAFPLLDASSPSTDSVYAVNFSPAGPNGRWTKGPSATIRLASPDSDRDAVLTAEVGAALDPVVLPVQRTRITVNDQFVCEWVFDHGGIESRELTIPQRLFNGATLEIKFQFSGTVSPAEVGKGKDRRQLALLFQNIQLHSRGPTVGAPLAATGADGKH